MIGVGSERFLGLVCPEELVMSDVEAHLSTMVHLMVCGKHRIRVNKR